MIKKTPSHKELLVNIPLIEQQASYDALNIYAPAKDHTDFYHGLCREYLTASPAQRNEIRDAIDGNHGIINQLLGYVYQCAEWLKETHSKDWLQIGLAAASIRGDGPDFRDFYMALSELFVAALEAGIDPKNDFNAIGGRVPRDFHTFPVLKEQLARIKKS